MGSTLPNYCGYFVPVFRGVLFQDIEDRCLET